MSVHLLLNLGLFIKGTFHLFNLWIPCVSLSPLFMGAISTAVLILVSFVCTYSLSLCVSRARARASGLFLIANPSDRRERIHMHQIYTCDPHRGPVKMTAAILGMML